ncbi:dihydrolipoamide dehydrogenase [Thermosporothrix hazakensis]|jgi:dihydrolipoamide dehydrogenase|uniref:Dihydrolipoamide dehydrogenase n=2 Tax=Thermosporothrix TaxID=768650 RepID=A0A326U3Z9_THEHA|nr:FAD-dependent oxidoreductase [Thermosporothrix hazakensis]PZW26395.1 dihydrolipoamide dehydrogenase [Thermosporothrix hazakensis]BBH90603.1 dihydrolipoyl dehydrogenase [Thermosporothrix sp. COM3]GCE48654.1 dihydrolipoyl dehydrogenase [Thermosporothrix hazakensis]
MVVGDVTTAVDVLILGAGPAGYAAAIRAAQLGRKVTLVEPGPVGGTCLNRGCIPLKALLEASERYARTGIEELAQFGISAETVSFDWSKMQAWKQGVIERLSNGVRRLLTGNQVELVQGIGWFLNEKEVRVEGEHGSLRFAFEHCVIATGAGAPLLPTDVLTPEQALKLDTLPEQVTIAGNDYIALELATALARLGVTVELAVPGERLLPEVEPAAVRLLQTGLRKLKIRVKTGVVVEQLKARPLVVCKEVRPATAGLRLDVAGVQVDEQGGIKVDSMMRTSNPAVYAAGDCLGSHALAAVALKQGKVAAEVLSGMRVQFAPMVVPQVVQGWPELAAAGLTAEAATRAGYQVKTGRFPLAANGRALTLGADLGAVFVVADAEHETVLGGTVVGPRAADLLASLTLAIEMGATLTDLTEILYAHPALSEAVLEGAENALARAIHVLNKP